MNDHWCFCNGKFIFSDSDKYMIAKKEFQKANSLILSDGPGFNSFWIEDPSSSYSERWCLANWGSSSEIKDYNYYYNDDKFIIFIQYISESYLNYKVINKIYRILKVTDDNIECKVVFENPFREFRGFLENDKIVHYDITEFYNFIRRIDDYVEIPDYNENKVFINDDLFLIIEDSDDALEWDSEFENILSGKIIRCLSNLQEDASIFFYNKKYWISEDIMKQVRV